MRQLKGCFRGSTRAVPLLSGVSATAVLLALLVIIAWTVSLAPFGDRTLAMMDGDIQYLDFFAFFSDVLKGENGIKYTFSSFLGGNAYGLYAYYLASPLSFFVQLWPKEELPLFFNAIVAAKLSVSSFSMAYFLSKRFNCSINQLWLCVCLGVCYGLSQWSIAQASNVMWLDAAYLLPFLMLGVWKGAGESHWTIFSVFAALSLMFNWYMGAVNCLFSAVYFIFEIALLKRWNSRSGWQSHVRFVIKTLVQYFIATVIGVALAAVVLVPMLASMVGSSKGSMDFGLLTHLDVVRSPVNLVQSYVIGGISSESTCCLYAGALVLIGVLGNYASNRTSRREKWIFSLSLAFIMALVCWEPLVSLFSLLKSATSYYVRYAYVAIAWLVVLSSFFLLRNPFVPHATNWYRLIKIASLFIGLQLVLGYVAPEYNTGHLYLTVLAEAVVVFCLMLICKATRKNLCILLLCGLVAADVSASSISLAKTYSLETATTFKEFCSTRSASISKLSSIDDGIYRINGVADRLNRASGQNESLGQGYWSISGYSSIAEPAQLSLLGHLGYRAEASCMLVDSEPILAADSLLGAKYIFYSGSVPGLSASDVIAREKNITESGEEYPVTIFRNPYVFPMAFTIDDNNLYETPIDGRNPFESTNQIYKYLFGPTGEVYKSVPYTTRHEETTGGATTIYSLSLLDGEYAYFGYLPWAWGDPGLLRVEGHKDRAYGGWLSQSLFSVPFEEDAKSATVTYQSTSTNDQPVLFYALDLSRLKKAAQVANEMAVDINTLDNGNIALDATVESKQSLFLSVPNHNNWTATVNGRVTAIETLDNCLMIIPLEDGANHIELNYSSNAETIGAAISTATLLLMVIYAISLRGRRRSSRYTADSSILSHNKVSSEGFSDD